MEGSGELQCVGRMEIAKLRKPVGFLCGTLPVPTDATAFRLHPSALVAPPAESDLTRVAAPRYQMLPAETDLNTLPLLPNIPDRIIPTVSKGDEGCRFENGVVCQSLSRKCEALAVAGLTKYGDEIDVVAPVDILKQIFKIPYSKPQLSIAVHRIGDTLILNTGPDVDEGEKIFRRQGNQPMPSDPSIFLNFAMHSVRAEACDCPPGHRPSEEQSSTNILPGAFGCGENAFATSPSSSGEGSKFPDHHSDDCTKDSEGNSGKFFLRAKPKKQKNRSGTINTSSGFGENLRSPVHESDKFKRIGNSGFLRVLFWQFHNFRMLLGSDLLLFSNEKYAAVSLHLWDVSRQVTPLTWLEAWLDNIMASVPELAICYHRNGVVQGYELIKTNDIFLLKGLSEDGSPAFHPQVVHQNGLSVLRFLQDNCKQDPGAYWLYKSAGEDAIQLFDLSVIPKSNSSGNNDEACSSLPSLMQKRRRESLFSLGTLLYRIAHKLSLSKAPDNRVKCVDFFKKCLDFLYDHDHLVVRAHAHEQFARLILKCYEELELTSDSFLLESRVTVTDLEDETSEFSQGMFELMRRDSVSSETNKKTPTSSANICQDLEAETSYTVTLEAASCLDPNVHVPPTLEVVDFSESMDQLVTSENPILCNISSTTPHIVQTIADLIFSKLAAIHHVSQAIKSLRWSRQLHNAEGDFTDSGQNLHGKPATFSFCACGDIDCIEVCNIREWLPKSRIDRQMWKLILLLGESYLALGEAYMEDGQLHRTLKVVELACLLYGSMPQHIDDAWFISSMTNISSCQMGFNGGKCSTLENGTENLDCTLFEEGYCNFQFSPIYLFWAKAWLLVGDVYAEHHRTRGKEISTQADPNVLGNEVRMSSEVAREVKRLTKKLGQVKQNCSFCSLINCSCQSDRASSGNNASSSSGDSSYFYSRKQSQKLSTRKKQQSSLAFETKNLQHDGKYMKNFSSKEYKQKESSIADAAHDGCEDLVLGPIEEAYSESYVDSTKSTEEECSEPVKDTSEGKHGGIFRFLEGPKLPDVENNILAAIYCYDAARNAMNGLSVGAAEMHSVVRKRGWIFNELGRYRLEMGNLVGAEFAFADAINAFKEVSDHANIILINCNLGHGRRALAEEIVSKLGEMRKHSFLQNAYIQAVKCANLEYIESLRCYRSAKMELDSIVDGVDPLLHNEVYTQLAHTNLRLGMLLAGEGIYAKASDNGSFVEFEAEGLKGLENDESLSAGDAIREALSIYESLGDLRKQEAAFAHFHLACYHRDLCLKYMDLYGRQLQLPRSESNLRKKAKWHASLADKNWQKSRDFYSAKTHPAMYVDILLEHASLSVSISSLLHSSLMLETALLRLLEARHIDESDEKLLDDQDPNMKRRFWDQLRTLLKNMLSASLISGNQTGIRTVEQAIPAGRFGDASKLQEMYRTSLKSEHLGQLSKMRELWSS